MEIFGGMKMAAARKKIYTPEEYLKMEERSEIRHEFVNGEIFDMSGSSVRHNDICGNIAFGLRTIIRKEKLPCHISRRCNAWCI